MAKLHLHNGMLQYTGEMNINVPINTTTGISKEFIYDN